MFSKIATRIIKPKVSVTSSSSSSSVPTSSVDVQQPQPRRVRHPIRSVSPSISSSSSSSSSSSTNSSRRSENRTDGSRRSRRQHRRRTISPSNAAVLHSLVHLRLKGLVIHPQECVICTDEYEVDDIVTILPCGHMHHSNCIMGWLCKHTTCPVCRWEAPTEVNGLVPTTNESDESGITDTMGTTHSTTAPKIFPPLDSEWENAVFARRDGSRVFQKSSNFDLIMSQMLRLKDEQRGPVVDDCDDDEDDDEDDDVPDALRISDDDDDGDEEDYDTITEMSL
jgi:hypothetical protein